MKVYHINWTKCIAFSSDSASVMMGKNNSIFTRIAESSPDVYPVGCECQRKFLRATENSAMLKPRKS